MSKKIDYSTVVYIPVTKTITIRVPKKKGK